MKFSPLGWRYAVTTPPAIGFFVPWIWRLWTSPMANTPIQILHYVGAAALFVLLGFIVADLTNPGTWPAMQWERVRRRFKIDFRPASDLIEGREFELPNLTLRAIKHASLTSIEVVLYENIQWTIKAEPVLINRIGPKDFSKGEEVKIKIASISREQAHQNQWGDGDFRRSMVSGSGNLVEARIVSKGKIKQRYAVFISYKEMEGNKTSYFYLPEDRYVFGR